MFRSTFYFLRLLVALAVGLAFCVGLYLAFEHFSGVGYSLPDLGLITDKDTWVLPVVPDSVKSKIEQVAGWQDWLQDSINKYSFLDTYLPDTIDIFKEDTAPSLLLRIGLVADSHEDNEMLREALAALKGLEVDLVIHSGDMSRVGTKSELQFAKGILDESGLEYHTVIGDHDLWASEGPANYEAVFGPAYKYVTTSGTCLLFLDNSDVYFGLSQQQWSWLNDDVAANCDSNIYVFTHIPLYHPSSSRAMGEKSEAVKQQASDLFDYFAVNEVKAFLSGDIHYSSQYQHPIHNFDFVVLGALTRERNLQTPRFGLLTIYADAGWEFEELIVTD